MSATTIPEFAVIEVPGCGMRLRAMRDPAGWSVSGWRRTKGTRVMVMFASADGAPTFSEIAGQHHVIVDRAYVALPATSSRKLRDFITEVEGK